MEQTPTPAAASELASEPTPGPSGDSAPPTLPSKQLRIAGSTVFAQMVSKMGTLNREALLLAHRVWKVKFVGKRIYIIPKILLCYFNLQGVFL